eukprot:264309-Chlamydomonas_euryale.AAC.3
MVPHRPPPRPHEGTHRQRMRMACPPLTTWGHPPRMYAMLLPHTRAAWRNPPLMYVHDIPPTTPTRAHRMETPTADVRA